MTPNRHRGFTLIELLVAITVLAIVAVLGWRGLDTIIRSRVVLTSDLERTRGLQLAFAQMQSDCDHYAKPADIGNRPALSVQPGRVTLVRMVFLENQPSRVQVVAYRISEGVLTRRESPATRNLAELDAAWTAAMTDAGTLPAVVLHPGVSAMTVRSWIDNDWREAGMEPPRRSTGAVAPAGIEVTLRLHDRQDPMVKSFLLGPV